MEAESSKAAKFKCVVFLSMIYGSTNQSAKFGSFKQYLKITFFSLPTKKGVLDQNLNRIRTFMLDCYNDAFLIFFEVY